MSVIRAAGGLVVRGGLVLVVHRPRYDDWTFPKGKAEAGESDEACALREVLEETGYSCELGASLATTEYLDRKGRPKIVRWFAMRPLSGAFEPGDEVDELRWELPAGAARLLSYRRDIPLLDLLP